MISFVTSAKKKKKEEKKYTFRLLSTQHLSPSYLLWVSVQEYNFLRGFKQAKDRPVMQDARNILGLAACIHSTILQLRLFVHICDIASIVLQPVITQIKQANILTVPLTGNLPVVQLGWLDRG